MPSTTRIATARPLDFSSTARNGGENICRRARAAEKTWIAGGRAEERVGEELEGLRAHGFYVFHDVPLPGVGNVDHVVLAPPGVFAVEVKTMWGSRKSLDDLPALPAMLAQARDESGKIALLLRTVPDVGTVRPVLVLAGPGAPTFPGPVTVDGVLVVSFRWTSGRWAGPIATPTRRPHPARATSST